MKNLRGNKIMAAILVALLLGLVASLIASMLVRPKMLAKNVYVVNVPAQVGGNAASEPVQENIKDFMAKADIEAGKNVARKCQQCHDLTKDGKNRIGPVLWNIVGMPKHQRTDYPYSTAAMCEKGVWTVEDLDAYLTKPSAYTPGTRMSFVGLNKIEDRANVIAYLKTLSG
jgi:cytochrome c